MTPAEASRALEMEFSNNWILCPVVYENTPPISYDTLGQPSLFDERNPFIVLEISPGYSRPITIPTGCVRRFASLFVTIYVPRDVGSRVVDNIISELLAQFQYKEITDLESMESLRCKDLSTVSRNVIVDEWVRTMVAIAFEYDQTVQ